MAMQTHIFTLIVQKQIIKKNVVNFILGIYTPISS